MKRFVVVALLLLLACGRGGEPVAIPPDRIPFPLSRSIQPEPPGAPTKRFRITFVRRGFLTLLPREESSRLPLEEVAVRALLDGPTDPEQDRGNSTEIPPSTRLLGLEVVDQVADVDLSQEFQGAASSRGFQLRVAQVVTTLVQIEGVIAVRFAIDGQVVSVPTGKGEIVDRPVTAADYAGLRRKPGG